MQIVNDAYIYSDWLVWQRYQKNQSKTKDKKTFESFLHNNSTCFFVWVFFYSRWVAEHKKVCSLRVECAETYIIWKKKYFKGKIKLQHESWFWAQKAGSPSISFRLFFYSIFKTERFDICVYDVFFVSLLAAPTISYRVLLTMSFVLLKWT